MKLLRRRKPSRTSDDGGPVLVGDVWMDARGRTASSWRTTARATWGRRLGVAARGFARAGAWIVGVESRGAVESRAITSVPWAQGGSANSGSVSTERALRLAPVYAAGRVLASNIAAAPLRQYREMADGVQRLSLSSLFSSPSSQGNLNDWIWRAVLSLVFRGNAVGFVTARDYLGYPTMVEWLPMDWVQVVDSMPYGPGSFVNPIWYVLGNRVDNPEDIVHIPWFTLPGKILGLSPIGAFASMATTNLAAQEYMEAWHSTGGVPPGTFKSTTQKVDQAEASVIKERLVAAIRSRQPIVYGKDWDYNAITVPAYEAQFISTMKLGATQLAAIYGIPPELIGGETGGSMSYSSPQQRELELIQFGLLPYMSKLESHFSDLTPRGQCVKFDADHLIRLDPLTRWSIWEKTRLIGGMNIDEIRNREDMPPLPDGKGQDYTPLPIAAGVNITPPTIRSDDDDPRLRLIPGKGQQHG
ncbi:phage portal protein [Streptomyces sp. NPDC005648]|uniref:phage portal protein n=1 Tax=Streptomyces sp. NPDC005648 TaxID=3157044 RepID=UPI0033ACC561